MKVFASLALVVALGACLCACGTATAHSSQPSMILHVVRASHWNATHITLEKTVTNSQAVQKLYSAALALPKFEDASCPTITGDDTPQDYLLAFQQGTAHLLPMTYQAWGCAALFIGSDNVHRSPDVRWTGASTFSDLLAQTMGVSPNAV